VQLLDRAGWFANLSRKRRALDRMLPTIRATSDALTRDLYLARASEAAGVAKELLAREVDAVGPTVATRQGGAQRQDEREPPPSVEEPRRARSRDRRRRDRRAQGRGESAERELVRVMVHERGEVDALAERVDPGDFRNAELREIFQTLVHLGDEASIEDLSSALTPAAVEELQALLEEPDALVDVRRTIDDSLMVLRKREMKARMTEITRMLPLATGDEKDVLIVEKTRLQREMQALRGSESSPYGTSRS
jgi:DNA primase